MTEKRKRWTVNETCDLIEIYRDHVHLWNTNDVNYRNKIKKFDSINILANVFQTSVPEIERKLKNMHIQYRRERRAYRNMKKSGVGHVFKPRWFGYNAMTFLEDRNKPEKNTPTHYPFENIQHINPAFNRVEKTNGPALNQFPYDEYVKEENETQEDVYNVRVSQDEDAELASEDMLVNVENSVDTEEYIGKKADHKIDVEDERLNTDYSNVKSNDTSTQRLDNDSNKNISTLKSILPRSEERDEFDVYGELIAHKLRKLKSDLSKATVQHLINGILFEAQLGKYDFPNHIPPSSIPSVIPDQSNSLSNSNTWRPPSTSVAPLTVYELLTMLSKNGRC